MLFRLADESANHVKAIFALNSGPIGKVGFAYDLLPEDVAWFPTRQFIEHYLTYAERFPSAALDNFCKSLVPMTPKIVNQMGHRGHPGLEINHFEEMRKLPILFLSSEDDRVSANSMTEETAAALGARHLYLGADWGLPGFGHMVPIELGTLDVAAKVSAWFASLSS